MTNGEGAMLKLRSARCCDHTRLEQQETVLCNRRETRAVGEKPASESSRCSKNLEVNAAMRETHCELDDEYEPPVAVCEKHQKLQ